MTDRAKWKSWWAAALLAVLVGAYDLWAVRAAGSKFEWGYDLFGYYDLLGRALAGGHFYLPIQPSPQLLAQPDPWDPAVDASLKWHDMALYGGRYYLYFGAAPAVLLFTPWRLMTGHDLPENFGMFLLASGGFLFSCGALLRVLDLAAARPGWFVLSLLVLALGVCQGVPYLLNRVAVYEVAIAGGYFCTSAAVFCLAWGMRSRRAPYWFAASGLMFGLAVASRPHLVLIGVIAAAGLTALRPRRVLAFAAAWSLVGAAVAGYNYGRFGDPFEFGFRYQLAGRGQNRIEPGARNLTPGAYFMLLSRPQLSPVFPWMRMVFRFPFDSAERHPLPPEYFVEPTAGALWISPFLVAALLVPSTQRLGSHSKQASPAEARTILWIATAGSAAVLLFLMATHLATHRYEVDFLPLAVWAATANLGIHISSAAGFRRGALSAVLALVVGYSAVANLALGIAGPYDDILKNRPASYVRMARWFSPFREYRRAIDPAIAVSLTARFIPEPAGFREPLITIGQSHFQYFLYAERAGGTLRLVSQSDDSKLTYEMPDPGAKPVSFRLVYNPQTHKLATTVNGEEVIAHTVGMLIAAPAQVAIGENFSDLGLTARRFTGRLQLDRKDVTD
ncbi:MAG TPA: hypothetical protein VE959_14590 [Bryobacteraceae bacterium]|nr:hypothetical protein [Bryobacteraceae bacterium]